MSVNYLFNVNFKIIANNTKYYELFTLYINNKH